ncbi:magnesium transporter [Amphibacillus sediminis]|uniref:magnesium transporter n=1 Tax=Amphibacillus sediminis TaxID=360185 RepID=UPI00082B4291|nr:magnesium transporter [Amphibacillus sediminis]
MVKEKLNYENYALEILKYIKDNQTEEFRELFLSIHPTNQISIFVQLNQPLRKRLYQMISAEEFAPVFEGLEPEKQKQVIFELDHKDLVALLNTLPTDEITDFLANQEKQDVTRLLNAMDKKRAMVIRELLSYPLETAGGIMAKEFMAVHTTDKAGDVIDNLRFKAPNAETIYYLYVLDQQSRLVGVLSLRDLIVAPVFETVENIMRTDLVTVTTSMDQEDVAKVMKRYDFLAVPVVTKDNILTGIITVDDVMDVMDEEVAEDFDEFTAANGGMDINISSFKAARKRAPWIILLLIFGLITGSIIRQFEQALEEVVLLAVFIPLIMDSAGNVGTQSLAVVVRAIATDTFAKKGLLHAVKREFFTGLLLGVSTALFLFVVIPILYGNFMLSVIVAVSLLLTLSVSAIVGSVIPVIINKINLDPAIASGPFITTINDILGLSIYFTIATHLLSYL